MKKLKKIGIIGGADPAASCLLYEKIIDCCLLRDDCNNGSDFPEITIINFPFTRGIRASDFHLLQKTLINELQYCVDKLVACNVDIIALACNTLHSFVPSLNLYDKEFVHLIAATLKQLESRRVKNALILATEATVKNKIYQHPTIDFITPTQEQQQIINTIIEQIHAGSIQETSAQKLDNIIKATKTRNIILGCTDLPVLHNKFTLDQASITIFDTVQILAQTLVKRSFNQ